VRYALRNPTPKNVRDDVGKLIPAGLSAAEFDELRNELATAGFLARGKRKNTFALTAAGRERALRFLGLSDLPPRANWTTIIAKHLFPKAAGLSADAAAKLDNGDKLAAFLLRWKYGLPRAGSKVDDVLEALACKELGFPEETTLDGLMEAVLTKLVGKRLTRKELVVQFPRFRTGLTDIKADPVRRKVVQEWLAGAAPQPTEPPDRRPAEPFDLAAFAATVRALAANSPPEDRFHDNKVFIAPLWRASQREPTFPRLGLDEFKQRLVEANSRNLLHLSRADLVQAMDPHLVAESETAHLNATFHFVLLEEAHP
jgi:hypothetical protein